VPVPGKLVFQALAGSRAYGLARAGSDEDWRGIYQASTESLYGLRGPVEHVDFPPDQQYWELTHFARMCLAGNPNIMELLWIPSDMIAVDSAVARSLRAMRRSFLTSSCASAYLGWIKSTRMKMNAQGLAGVSGDPAVEAKRRSHLVRIALNFRSLLRKGEMDVRLTGSDLELVSAIKTGRMDLDKVDALINSLEAECLALAKSTNWPAPDPKPVDRLLVRARRGEL